jgi:hypothetical protein
MNPGPNPVPHPSESLGNPEVNAGLAPAEAIPRSVDLASGIATQPSDAAPPKVIGYCRECGKALLEGAGVHSEVGAIYCDVHRPGARTIEYPNLAAPQPAPWTAAPQTDWNAAWNNPQAGWTAGPTAASPYHASQPLLPPSSPLHRGASPGLAFVLGLIPGVGAVYNGQYAKGLLHVVILGLAISLNKGGSFEFGPLFGLLVTCFWFYMAFDAYHTAKLRQAGVPVDEFSGIFPNHPSSGLSSGSSGRPRVPVGPIILIVLGVLFLLSNLEIIEIRRLLRFWPAVLIVMGFYMIYVRLTESSKKPSVDPGEKTDGR